MNLQNKDWQYLYNLCDIIKFNYSKGLNFDKSSIAYQYISKVNPAELIIEGSLNLWRQGKTQPLLDRHILSEKDSFKLPFIDFDLLKSIISKRNFTPLNRNTIAIHLRSGDCIHEAPAPSKFPNIIEKYNLLKSFDSCFLFTGNHNNINKRESIEYNLNVKSEIEKLNLNCEIISGSADDDFSLLSTSECYIAGYRGFSWLSACINPNLVIWDIQDPPNFPWVYPRSHINQAIQGYDFYLENHAAN